MKTFELAKKAVARLETSSVKVIYSKRIGHIEYPQFTEALLGQAANMIADYASKEFSPSYKGNIVALKVDCDPDGIGLGFSLVYSPNAATIPLNEKKLKALKDYVSLALKTWTKALARKGLEADLFSDDIEIYLDFEKHELFINVGDA